MISSEGSHVWNDTDRRAQEVQLLIGAIGKLWRDELQRRLNELDLGITRLEFATLHCLASKSQTSSELGHVFLLDASTMVPVVDSLVRRGFVQRRRDPGDRRRYPLSITEEGIQLLEKLSSINQHDPLGGGLKGLTAEAQSQLVTSLRYLLTHMPYGETALSDIDARLELYQHGVVRGRYGEQ